MGNGWRRLHDSGIMLDADRILNDHNTWKLSRCIIETPQSISHSIIQRQLSPVAKNSILSELYTICQLKKTLERGSGAFEFSLWDEQTRARPPSFRESATPQKNQRS